MVKKVILIAGEICSGKDTIVRRDYSSKEYKQIDLGELVREKFNTVDRIFDNNLEPYFIDRIKDIIKDNEHTYVITGLRQKTLAKKIVALFHEVKFIYLVVPRDILKNRYKKRADKKDAKLSFEDAIKGDQSLGMDGLQSYLLTEVKCNFIKNC